MTYHDRPNTIPYFIAYLDVAIIVLASCLLFVMCGTVAVFGPVMLALLYVARVYEIPNIFDTKRNLAALTVALVISTGLALAVDTRPDSLAQMVSAALLTSVVILVSNVGVSRHLFDRTEHVWIDLPADLEVLKPAAREVERKTLNKVCFRYSREAAAAGRPVNMPRKCRGMLLKDPANGSSAGERQNVDVALPELFESILKRIPTELLVAYPDLYDDVFRRRRPYDLVKRAVDVVVSVVVLVVSFPLLIVVGLLILFDDGLPVVFTQERVGLGGKRFQIKKFRSLRCESVDEKDPNGTIETRLLRIGKFIRKTHIDEILNLLCVLGGYMSIVGPRPEMPVYHEKVARNIPGYRYRLYVKPGITGWAQINYRHTSSLEEYDYKTSLDFYYVKNRGPLLDLKIVAKTVYILLTNHGSR